MATVKEIYEFINSIAPFDIQESFDNAGFLVGRKDREVRRILVALDITHEVAEEAARLGAELIVAHHPVIFNPVKSVTDETLTGQVLLALAEQKSPPFAPTPTWMPPAAGSTTAWPRRWS